LIDLARRAADLNPLKIDFPALCSNIEQSNLISCSLCIFKEINLFQGWHNRFRRARFSACHCFCSLPRCFDGRVARSDLFFSRDIIGVDIERRKARVSGAHLLCQGTLAGSYFSTPRVKDCVLDMVDPVPSPSLVMLKQFILLEFTTPGRRRQRSHHQQ
jgi:hypothetical protein